MSAGPDRELKVTYGYGDAGKRSRFYKDPALLGYKRIRLQRANDALHDLEVRLNVRTNTAHVELDDGILRAVSVSCAPGELKVKNIYHVYVLFAGNASLDITEQAAGKLQEWLAEVVPAPTPGASGTDA